MFIRTTLCDPALPAHSQRQKGLDSTEPGNPPETSFQGTGAFTLSLVQMHQCNTRADVGLRLERASSSEMKLPRCLKPRLSLRFPLFSSAEAMNPTLSSSSCTTTHHTHSYNSAMQEFTRLHIISTSVNTDDINAVPSPGLFTIRSSSGDGK